MNELFTKLNKLYESKNSDYGDAFTHSLNKYGYVAYLVRAEDKLMRYNNLQSERSKRLVDDETVVDTVEDMLNYTIMLLMYVKTRLKGYEVGEYTTEYNTKVHKSICIYLEDIIEGGNHLANDYDLNTLFNTLSDVIVNDDLASGTGLSNLIDTSTDVAIKLFQIAVGEDDVDC